VGSTLILEQGGWVGGGVGMMRVSAVGTALGVSGGFETAQELRKIRPIDRKYMNDFCINSLCWQFFYWMAA
jgi:hypothetical protein